jgi:hypothetical protein
MVLPARQDSCLFAVCLFVVWDGQKLQILSFAQSIELKLGGDLELVSQISVHVLVLRFDCF